MTNGPQRPRLPEASRLLLPFLMLPVLGLGTALALTAERVSRFREFVELTDLLLRSPSS